MEGLTNLIFRFRFGHGMMQATEDAAARPEPAVGARARVGGSWDVLAAALALAGAAVAALGLPEGQPLRLALTLPVIMVAPGYLLVQALVVPAAPVRRRLAHLVFALGASPAVVGLLALATAMVPGAFKAGPIIATVTVACLLLAAVAMARRMRWQVRTRQAQPSTATATSP